MKGGGRSAHRCRCPRRRRSTLLGRPLRRPPRRHRRSTLARGDRAAAMPSAGSASPPASSDDASEDIGMHEQASGGIQNAPEAIRRHQKAPEGIQKASEGIGRREGSPARNLTCREAIRKCDCTCGVASCRWEIWGDMGRYGEKQSGALGRCRKPTEATGSHQKPSEVPRSNQKFTPWREVVPWHETEGPVRAVRGVSSEANGPSHAGSAAPWRALVPARAPRSDLAGSRRSSSDLA